MGLKGIENNRDREPMEDFVYLMQPFKENLKSTSQKIDMAFEPMDGIEVKEMLEGCSGISFNVEMDEMLAKEFENYKNTY